MKSAQNSFHVVFALDNIHGKIPNNLVAPVVACRSVVMICKALSRKFSASVFTSNSNFTLTLLSLKMTCERPKRAEGF